MGIEEISAYMHQCKRHVDPGTAGGGSEVQTTLQSLLCFKVPREKLDTLQRGFRLERWEALLSHSACKPGAADPQSEPLPLGFEWSKCGMSIQLHSRAFDTQDLPPWRRCAAERKAAEPEDSGRISASLCALGQLRSALADFDEQTYQDVASFSERIAGTERRLTGLFHQTESLRDEVERSTLERDERQGYKKALMEALQVAVETATDAAAENAPEPVVGYCQGMNFVAAVLLITLGNDQDAFWMLLAMLEGYHYRHIFASGVPLLPLRVFQFSGLVRQRLPKLWRHLSNEGFSLEIFAHQCVMTLFAYCIEPGFLAHVWDVFFFVGWKAFFRIGLGIFAKLQPRLLEMGIEEISAYMHRCHRASPVAAWRHAGATVYGEAERCRARFF